MDTGMQEKNENLQRLRVLVVDDNEVVRRVLGGIIRQDEALQLIGEATHGESALEAVRLHKPDVVCLDMMMPGRDGISVLEELRETSPATQVVIITGYATPDLINKARTLGAVGFVIKPFSAAKVLSAIHVAAKSQAVS
jgi:two-component system chemotaxis response regulator CheY